MAGLRSFHRAAVVVAGMFLLAGGGGGTGARAQSVSDHAAANMGAKQCGVYVEAYRAGSEEYRPYLRFTEEVARTRDAHESGTRYVAALHDSAPAANALWLSNWCAKSPLKKFAEASNRLLEELTEQGSTTGAGEAPAKKPESQPGIKDSLVILLGGGQTAPANSCKVGGTKYCSGCSIACKEGQTPKCSVGSDSLINNECFVQAKCSCW